ncbi:MAG: hypothetical protein ACKVVT_00560 [Dehalococcoidia bacterium]
MTSFGRAVDLDPEVAAPASSIAKQVLNEAPAAGARFDATAYEGAAEYHLRLLGGAWLLVARGRIPPDTALVFEEAVAWRLGRGGREPAALARRVTAIARAGR